MRPPIDHNVQPSTPSVKFPTLGGSVVGSLVSVTEFQATDFITKEPVTWPNGDPRMNKLLKLVLVREADVEFSTDANPGDVISVWLSGGRLYDYADAVREYMKEHQSGPAVGTMCAIKFTEEVPAQTKGFSPRKVLGIRFRPETPADKRWADLAEEAYRDGLDPVLVRPPAEEPF